MSHGQRISNRGERVSHLYPNDLYYAHLSLYRFVVPLARGGRVLDAGCGAGYGSAFLARHGAREVVGVDRDADAIAFCKEHFSSDGVRFHRMDVRRMSRAVIGPVDLVIASNTLEHVPGVPAFLRDVHALITPGGALVVAVPPITCRRQLVREMANPFHLNLWTPRYWHDVLRQYFGEIDVHGHRLARTDRVPDFDNHPSDCDIAEGDFTFPALDPNARDVATLSIVLVATAPKAAQALPPLGSAVAPGDASFSRTVPILTTLRPEALEAPRRPLRQLPGRAVALLRERGVVPLVRETVRYLRWQAMRLQTLRVQRRWRDRPHA